MISKKVWVIGTGVVAALAGVLTYTMRAGAALAAPPAPSGGGGSGGGVVPPSQCSAWRRATDADVARDGTQPVYMRLLNSQPLGYTEAGTYNGNLWKFVVCGGSSCDPPSTFQKDVRGFLCAG